MCDITMQARKCRNISVILYHYIYFFKLVADSYMCKYMNLRYIFYVFLRDKNSLVTKPFKRTISRERIFKKFSCALISVIYLKICFFLVCLYRYLSLIFKCTMHSTRLIDVDI